MRQWTSKFPHLQSPRTMGVACAVVSLLALYGCDQRPAPPSAEQLATLEPADSRLSKLYEHSCKACHAVPGSSAPLVHDRNAWDTRWSKGLSVLRNHVIVGFQAMPAGGQCTVCAPKDYDDLIRFMADREN